MKRVVSVSLGSSRRDHRVEIEILGERFIIERRGTDGDMRRARALIRELDGKVDALGLGGIDLYLRTGSRKFVLRDGKKLAREARQTPVVDGSGLKDTLERKVIEYLRDNFGFDFSGRKVLLVCAADRYEMARAFLEGGAELICGDLMFGLGLPLPLRSLTTLDRLGRIIGPVVCRLPFRFLYPTGKKQEVIKPKYEKYYLDSDIIAGDFHFIKKHLPPDLVGKTVITNTITPADVELLRRRGIKRLVTTTPDLGGRSFGTNVLEGVIVALAGKRPEKMTAADYNFWLQNIGFEPRIVEF